eukprot:2315094-Amphidinium_carterae.1
MNRLDSQLRCIALGFQDESIQICKKDFRTKVMFCTRLLHVVRFCNCVKCRLDLQELEISLEDTKPQGKKGAKWKRLVTPQPAKTTEIILKNFNSNSALLN